MKQVGGARRPCPGHPANDPATSCQRPGAGVSTVGGARGAFYTNLFRLKTGWDLSPWTSVLPVLPTPK